LPSRKGGATLLERLSGEIKFDETESITRKKEAVLHQATKNGS